ncbi:type I methionyl aminopeptidase [Thermocrinis minervae]|uniref:Methionine aminopeptidase n=1 Tax=Thermocrinis minervae TaxID=381751 RepID=A0A1M6RZK0_9AQUI|nr:type I methionyl aminopeptidase [Thermocrinis minervae]SHK37891.1 methionine aminopeptidase, type I [Thermocrinis minervae]
MAVELYSFKEIEKIKKACDAVVYVLKEVAKLVKPGISTWDLEVRARELCKDLRIKPAFLNYKPPFSDIKYPAALCVSVNSAIVHGLPKEEEILKEGDIVSIDFGAFVDGYAGDSAITVPVGQVDEQKELLMKATKEALEEATKACVAGNWLSDITNAIANVANKYGFKPVKGLGGHGIGRRVHEDPYVPNNPADFDGKRVKDLKLKQGMVLAIEPMIAVGSDEYVHEEDIKKDPWTVRTKDNSPCAHFEYVVAVTKEGPIVLTEFGHG